MTALRFQTEGSPDTRSELSIQTWETVCSNDLAQLSPFPAFGRKEACCKQVKSGRGNPHWHVSVFDIHLRTLQWTYCPGQHTDCYVSLARDHARHFSNRCNNHKVAKVVHGNQSDNHCNRSDPQLSILLPHTQHTTCILCDLIVLLIVVVENWLNIVTADTSDHLLIPSPPPSLTLVEAGLNW